MSLVVPHTTPTRSLRSPPPLPPPPPSRALEDAHRLQLLLARQRVEEAQQALLQAQRAADAAEQAQLQQQSAREEQVHEQVYKMAAAARVRTLLHARHDARLRIALLAWSHAAVQVTDVRGEARRKEEAEEGEEEQPRAHGRHLQGGWLELTILHLRPTVLASAIGQWSRAVAAMDRASGEGEG